jgi:hypothetical protein
MERAVVKFTYDDEAWVRISTLMHEADKQALSSARFKLEQMADEYFELKNLSDQILPVTEKRRTNEGPLITLVPLPSRSQFLNVIESAFGVMKKAVIHHSDYQSTQEMKSTISQHFRERNAYFNDNPRRAGKQLWKIDFFREASSLPSGNYREY